MQADFLKKTKENLKKDEFVVISDFSQNYSFVIQQATQSSYWKTRQATIHPFCIYYREEEGGELKNQSFVVIAESLKHNFTAFYQFQQRLMDYMRRKFQRINKIFFFSDGAAGQYKNRFNFYNLCELKSQGIDVEWHFSATAHGKSPCDAVGGIFKRNAKRASLQRLKESQPPISTPRELFEWAMGNDSIVQYEFCTEGEYAAIKNATKSVFDVSKIRQLHNTRTFHAFKPVGGNQVEIKKFSFSDVVQVFKLVA